MYCISRLRQLITENRLWPVEILRQKPVNPKVARVYDKCMSYCFPIVNYGFSACMCVCVSVCLWV